MNEQEAARQAADELYAHRHDPDEWGDEVSIAARPSRTSVVSCRLPTDEFRALVEAAKDVGESLSEYVRKAVALRRVGALPTGSIRTYSFGATHLHVTSSLVLSGERSDAPWSTDYNGPPAQLIDKA